MPDMEAKKYVRKPFIVEAIEVTKENIAELAPQVGTLVQNEGETPYIDVDAKKVPHVTRVVPGFFVTKMGKRTHCYSPKAFKTQFADADEHNLSWVAYLNGDPSGAEADAGG